MADSQDRQLSLIRYAVIGMALSVVIGISGFGYWYTAQNKTVSEELDNGDYEMLARPKPDRGKTITVREFFSYACGHCNTFEPVISKWEKGIDDDVEVIRVAVGGQRVWTALARAYYTAIKLDILERSHMRLFDGIHNRRLQLTSTKSIAEYLADDKVSVSTFYNTATKDVGVKDAYDEAQKVAARFGVTSVPTLVVAGKYLVSTSNGTRYALKVVDDLIEKERALR